MKILLLVLFLCPAMLFAQLPFACQESDSLNNSIVSVASSYIGKKVGRGECWDLAELVLDEINADWDGLYGFGRVVNLKTECIQPGDIVQFEKVFTHVTTGNEYYDENFPHHTAIVYRILGPGKIELIHQNFGDVGRKVGISLFDFSTVTKGKIQVFRPVKKTS